MKKKRHIIATFVLIAVTIAGVTFGVKTYVNVNYEARLHTPGRWYLVMDKYGVYFSLLNEEQQLVMHNKESGEELSRIRPVELENGNYRLECGGDGKALGASENQHSVILQNIDATTGQEWNIQRIGSSQYYFIENVKTGLSINRYTDDSSEPGIVNIDLKPYVEGDDNFVFVFV